MTPGATSLDAEATLGPASPANDPEDDDEGEVELHQEPAPTLPTSPQVVGHLQSSTTYGSSRRRRTVLHRCYQHLKVKQLFCPMYPWASVFVVSFSNANKR